jgi:hypothetical protein
METGATDKRESSLLLAWDGNHLQWLHCQHLTVLQCKTIPAAGSKALREALKGLKSALVSVDTVLYASDLPYFSMAPSRVVSGREKALQTIHLGPSPAAPVSFYSEVFGEELSLVEQDLPSFKDEVEEVWPLAKRASMALTFLESVVRKLRTQSSLGCIAIHVGYERAMMALFTGGELMWSMTTDDLAGDGVLYHVVNAMKRQDVTENVEMEIWFTGRIQDDSALANSFRRFFNRVEIKVPDLEWAHLPDLPQEWATLTRMMPCA